MSLETLGPAAVRDKRAAHPAEIALTRRIDLTTLRLPHAPATPTSTAPR